MFTYAGFILKFILKLLLKIMKPNAHCINWKKENNWSTASLLSLQRRKPHNDQKNRAGVWRGPGGGVEGGVGGGMGRKECT